LVRDRRPRRSVDAGAAAFMAAGRDGPVSRLPEEDAWLTTTFEGHPTAVVAVGSDGIAMVVGLPGTDMASLVSALAVVPARQVTVANPEAGQRPADARRDRSRLMGRLPVHDDRRTRLHQHRCVMGRRR
jgi:hypothetical protein